MLTATTGLACSVFHGSGFGGVLHAVSAAATTSATTYKVQVSADATATLYVGRRNSDTFVGGACTITVMEIAA